MAMQVLEPEARRRQRRFPHGPFLQLAVAEQHDGARVRPVELLGQAMPMPTDSAWPSEPVANSTPRRPLGRVAGEAAAGLTGERQLRRIDLAELDHAGVQRRAPRAPCS